MKPLLDRELASSFWLATIQISRVLAGFVVGIIVVRYLGSEDYGALMLALSISGLFSAFGSLGLPRVVLRELAAPRIDGRPVVATALVLQMLGGLVAVAGTWMVCVVLEKPPVVTTMAILFATALVFTGGIVLQQAFLASHSVGRSASANVLAIVAALVYRLSLVAATAHVVFFSLANLVQNVAFLVVSLLRARPVLATLRGRLRPSGKAARLLASAAAPLFLASLLQGIPLYSDRLIIGTALTLSEVGVYAVLLQLVTIPQMLVASFVAGASPRLIRAFADAIATSSHREVIETLSQATALAAIMLGGLVIVAPFAVPLLYGPEFVAPLEVIGLLCLGLLVIVPNTLRAEYLLVHGRQRLAIVIAAIHALVTVAVQAALIPTLGLAGAAIAYLIQSVVFAAVLNHLFPFLRPYARLYWAALGRGLTLRPLAALVRRLLGGRALTDGL